MRGWTIKQLALELDCTPSYISMIEGGKRNPRDFDFWARASELLSIPQALLRRRGGGSPPGGGDGTILADEEEILAAAWALFYCSGVDAAVPLVNGAIRRIRHRQDREALPAMWLSVYSRFEQLLGVIARDQGDHPAAIRHGRIGLDLAEQSGDIQIHATALMRLGRTFAAQQVFGEAANRAREAAVLAPRCPPTLRGYLNQNLADMLSRENLEARFVIEQRLGAAEAALSMPGGGEFDGSYVVLSESGIAHDWAMVLIRKKAPLDDCLGRIEQARRALPSNQVRWQTAMQCSEALAYAVNERPAEALDIIELTVPDARDSRSHMKRLNAAYRMAAGRSTPEDARVQRVGELLGLR
jgi:transcriptional regulator with XRE-family HTH domain